MNNVKSFRTDDLKELLKTLASESSEDKIRSNLKSLIIFLLEGGDFVFETLQNGGLNILVDLYKRTELTEFKVKITSVFLFLSSGSKVDKSVSPTLSEIAVLALCNLFHSSDLTVFVQSLNGMRQLLVASESSLKDKATPSPLPVSSPSPSSSSSSSSLPALPPSAAVLLFEQVTAVLLSRQVPSLQKVEVLETFLAIVHRGLLNHALLFALWMRDQKNRAGDGSGGGWSGFNSILKACEAFEAALKVLSESKDSLVLSATARMLLLDIKDNNFFPLGSSISLSVESSQLVNLSLRLVDHPCVGKEITVSRNRYSWPQSGGSWTIFLAEELKKGVYKYVSEFSDGDGYAYVGPGLAAKSIISTLQKSSFYEKNVGAFVQYGGIFYGNSSVYSGTMVQNSPAALISLELNTEDHSLYFLVDGKQMPLCIINVPADVLFGFSGYQGHSPIEIKSLQRLPAPTVDPNIKCTQYSWK